MASSFTIDDFGGNGYLYQSCWSMAGMMYQSWRLWMQMIRTSWTLTQRQKVPLIDKFTFSCIYLKKIIWGSSSHCFEKPVSTNKKLLCFPGQYEVSKELKLLCALITSPKLLHFVSMLLLKLNNGAIFHKILLWWLYFFPTQGCNGNQVIPAYDRALMQYADTLKKSGNSLPELLKLTHSRSYFKVWNEKGPCYPFYRQSYSLWVRSFARRL